MDDLATFYILGLVLGTLLTFFGYRFYKPSIFFGGFTLGAVSVFEYCYVYSNPAAYGAGLCSGIIFGTLAVVFYHLGVFFLGALWGITLGIVLNGLFLSRISYVLCECNTLLWTAVVTLGILFGLLSLTVHEHKQDAIGHHPRKVIIYFQTSFPGAYMFIRSFGYLCGGYESEIEISKVVAPSSAFYLSTVFTLVLALLGVWIQLRFTHFEHCGCDDPDDTIDTNLEERKALTSRSAV
jgi:hypothetical protein